MNLAEWQALNRAEQKRQDRRIAGVFCALASLAIFCGALVWGWLQ